MFDEKNHDRTDALSERMTRLGEQMNPSPRLMKAAATGVPLRASGIKYTAGTHVKQTVKAVLLYAACVTLILGAIMLLPNFFNAKPPVGTQPPETTTAPADRDTITNPEQYNEQTLKAWEAIKPHCSENATINDYRIWNIFQLRDMIICQYMPKRMSVATGWGSETIAGYTFWYDLYDSQMYVFTDQSKYTLQEAYDAGVLSQEDLGIIQENHKTKYPNFYIFETPVLTTPYVYDPSDPSYDLGKLLEDKTCVNDRIDQSSLHTHDDFKPYYPDTGIENLFDGIKTEADYTTAGTGVLQGSSDREIMCYFFDLNERATISAYVITTGSNCYTYSNRNPVAWHLYATNDDEAAAEVRAEGADFYTLVDSGKWTDLDYVWDGCMNAVNFGEHGYVIDEEKQGEYRYYCWFVEYTVSGNIDVAELELYSN